MTDEYRVNLFKIKIRESCPEVKLRFYWSKDRCHLVLKIGHEYYPREIAEEVGDYVMKQFKVFGIEAKENRDPLGIWRRSGLSLKRLPLWSISIPIDQAALPERKREELGSRNSMARWNGSTR